MPADSAADRADLLALQQGDTAALERLVARWEQPLTAFAWRYLRNATDARELALETFVRLHEKRATLRPDTNLSAWLFTTLTNLCHNRHRWWRRHPSTSLDASAGGELIPFADAAPAPDANLEQSEALAALDAAIAGLPHDLRTTLLLHHFERLSYREIAGIVGCSERGVETRLYRARQALRAALRAGEPFASAR
ncbi:MAG: RNA polymerase sigma factor [Candidatus Didemnitutus sp.]|nr:RNA polymerase sigma factor [Candidatus Didemnitutus sp.]